MFEPDDEPLALPVYIGGKDRTAARQLGERVIDPHSFETKTRLLPDGTTVRYRSKGGFPQVLTETKARPELVDWLFGRLVDRTHPWGLALDAGQAANADFTWPPSPVVVGRAPGATYAATTTAYPDIPGPCRWMDTRSPRTVGDFLTWAAQTGTPQSLNYGFQMLHAAYAAAGPVPAFSTPTPGGGSMAAAAGAIFPGQRTTESGTGSFYVRPFARLINGRFSASKLYRDGVDTGIVEKIAAASICTVPRKHFRIITLDSFGAADILVCHQMTVKFFEMSGVAVGSEMPATPITLPAGVAGIVSIDHPPVFNSSGTAAAVGAMVELTGAPARTDPAYKDFVRAKVLLIDPVSGVATEYPVAGDWEKSATGAPPGAFVGAGTIAHTDTQRSKENLLLGLGYRGDALRLVRLVRDATTTVYSEITQTGSQASGTVAQTAIQTTTSTATNTLLLDPGGTVLHTVGTTTVLGQSRTMTAGYIETAPGTYALNSVGATRTGTNSPSAAEVVVGVFADLAAGRLVLALEGSTRVASGGGITYTSSGSHAAQPIVLYETTAPGSAITTTHASLKLFDLDGVELGTALTLPSTRVQAQAGAGSGPTVVFSTETAGAPFPDGGTLPGIAASFAAGTGLSGGRIVNAPLSFDGVSVAFSRSGNRCVVSTLNGASCPFEAITYSHLETHNVVGVRQANGAWAFSAFSLPAYVGALGWLTEPIFLLRPKRP